MAWLAVLKRIQIAADLTRQVLVSKLSSQDPVLRRSDMAAFYEDCERDHPELAALAPSSQQKVRSALLQMLRDAGLLVGKAGQGGTLGTVQRPFLSTQVQEVVAGDDPALLAGFLLHGLHRECAAPAATGSPSGPRDRRGRANPFERGVRPEAEEKPSAEGDNGTP